jgi:hypothetical protein
VTQSRDILESVEIEMKYRQTPLPVLVDKGESGAGHVVGLPAKRLHKAFGEMRFASAQIANQGNHRPALKRGSQLAPKGLSLCRTTGNDRIHGAQK